MVRVHAELLDALRAQAGVHGTVKWRISRPWANLAFSEVSQQG